MPPYQYQFPNRKLVSQENSAQIEAARVPRARFINEWSRIMPLDAGIIYPFLVEDVLPGDHLSYNVIAHLRMSTPLFPLYSNLRVDTHFFFTPTRLLWTSWIVMMGEQTNPSTDIFATVAPYVLLDTTNSTVGSIWDYFGLPTVGQLTVGQTIKILAFPARAYNLIYNNYYRDQNLINSVPQETGSGAEDAGNYALRRRAKSHDLFTSCLPQPQKFTAPNVPVAGQAPVIGIGWDPTKTQTSGTLTVRETDDSPSGSTVYSNWFKTSIADNINVNSTVGGYPQVFADLSQATGVAINTFREAFLIQQLLERDQRGGTRYPEIIRSHFGVISPDFRLQRPEYIGGGSSPLVVTPIAQTVPVAGGTPLGALGGAATASGQHRASYAATEHGWILGLISIKAELAYQQGIPKMFQRFTRYDYYWPSLAQLGEQPILRQEIYATGTDSEDATVFGYQEAWHHYRTRTSEVCGIMRSTAASTIDQWHLAQKFTSAPTLNQTFIEDTPPLSRVLAAGTAANGQQFLADILIQRQAVRPLPAYGTPALLGRF